MERQSALSPLPATAVAKLSTATGNEWHRQASYPGPAGRLAKEVGDARSWFSFEQLTGIGHWPAANFFRVEDKLMYLLTFGTARNTIGNAELVPRAQISRESFLRGVIRSSDSLTTFRSNRWEIGWKLFETSWLAQYSSTPKNNYYFPHTRCQSWSNPRIPDLMRDTIRDRMKGVGIANFASIPGREIVEQTCCDILDYFLTFVADLVSSDSSPHVRQIVRTLHANSIRSSLT